MDDKPWYLYIIKCKDDKLYTGISNDVEKRVVTHNKGKGCKFTKYRLPVVLVYQELCGTRSTAIRREIIVKSFAKQEKISLIEGKLKFKREGPVFKLEIAGKTGSSFAASLK